MRPSWHEYFMFIAKVVSSRSTCNSRPTGCVIVKDKRVLTTGYNGALSGMQHCTDKGPDFCYRRSVGIPDDSKYNTCSSVHSEANAVAQASKYGISLFGSSAYLTLAPCYVCLKLLVSSGIEAIYYEHTYDSLSTDRDKLWSHAPLGVGLKVYEQVIISPQSYSFILGNIEGITSERKLPATQ